MPTSETNQYADYSDIDYRSLFESAPTLCLVLTPDSYRIVAASDAYLHATMTQRDQIIGKLLFDIFADDPSEPDADGARNLRASLERVVKHQAIDTMAVQRYSIRRPVEAGGEYEERYWSPINSPVLDEHGSVQYIIHRVEDVTEYMRLTNPDTGVDESASALFERISRMDHEIHVRAQEIQRTNEELRRKDFLLEVASKVGRFGGWIVDLPTNTVIWSEQVCDIHAAPPNYQPKLAEAINFYAPEYRPKITRLFSQCATDGIPFDAELQIFDFEGKRVWVRSIGEAVRNAAGEIIRVQGAFQDITERKATTAQIQQKNSLMAIAGRIARVGGWSLEKVDGRVHWSDEVYAILGFSPDYMPSIDTALALYLPDSRARITAALDRCLLDGTPFDLELELLTAQGHKIWARCAGEAERNEHDVILRVIGAFQEITNQKESEKSLRASESTARELADRLNATLESITDAFFTLDTHWNFTFLNTQAERILRRRASELIGKNIWSEFPGAVGSIFETNYRRAMELQTTVELEAFYASLDIWVDVRAYPSRDGLAVYFRDITEEKATYKALTASEERFRLLARSTNDAIWDWDLHTDQVWWNEGIERLFGYPRSELPQDSTSWTNFIYPDDLEYVWNDIQQAIHGDAETWQHEYRFIANHGQIAYVLDRGYIMRDEAGQAMRIIGGMTDLTAMKEAEQRLREQALLLDNAQDAIIVRSFDHIITYWNQGAHRTYGWSAAEAIGKSVAGLLYADNSAFYLATQRVVEQGEWTGELRQIRQDGEEVLVEARWSLLRDSAGAPRSILAINTDVTQRKLLEDQLLRAQRIESIGILAGGIAHDLNNILSPILLSAFLLKNDSMSERDRERLQIIEDSIVRAGEMVRQIVTFARGAESQWLTVDVQQIISSVASLLRDSLDKRIRVVMSVEETHWPLQGDPTQIHQALVNLCVNAQDALPHGGELRIQVENKVLDRQFAAMHAKAEPGPYIVISVSDDGIGIPKSIQDRIFTPFFTTKDEGRGTGLGLPTVRDIVRKHGGFIDLRSEEGNGTTFSLYFPTTVNSQLAGHQETHSLPTGNGQLILVVDDESAVRTVTEHTLEAFNYRVLTAEDGASAVALYAQYFSEVSLVLTDTMMPVMDGNSLTRALRRINPEVNIVIASGLSETVVPTTPSSNSLEVFLPKPYTATMLLTVIDKVLKEA